MEKLDYKKEYPDLYLPKNKPVFLEVPAISFLMVDGHGDPNGEEYQNSVAVLYSLSFTIKMSKMSGNQPKGYFDYVVSPLEGLWGCDDGIFDIEKRDAWSWTSMIRQPEFVTEKVFQWALVQAAKKKPELDFSKARLATYSEGSCVQLLHVGPFCDEPKSLALIEKYSSENHYIDDCGERRHHEIYLSDPRKTAPEKLKTVLRHPVKIL